MNNTNSEYLIIEKSILPEYFDLVLRAKSLVEDEDVSVSLACKQTGISRSTFYKYKDKIHRSSGSFGKKSIISFKFADSPGVLSSVVKEIYSCGGNIITINSGLPIKGITFTTIVIDVSTLKIDLTELVRQLKLVDGVKSVNVVAVE